MITIIEPNTNNGNNDNGNNTIQHNHNLWRGGTEYDVPDPLRPLAASHAGNRRRDADPAGPPRPHLRRRPGSSASSAAAPGSRRPPGRRAARARARPRRRRRPSPGAVPPQSTPTPSKPDPL